MPDPRCAPAMLPALGRLVAAALVLAVAACASRAPAPIEERAPRSAPAPIAAPGPARTAAPEPDWRPPTYIVKRGDTLHAIALDHGFDYRELAAWNNIENPNVILVGQVLRLAPPGASAPAGAAGVTTMPLRTAPPVVAGDARPVAAPSSAAPSASQSAAAARNTENYKAQPKALKEPWSEQALRDVQRMAAAAPAAEAPPPPVASAAAPPAPPIVAPMSPSVAPPAAAPTAAPQTPAASTPSPQIARADPKPSGSATDDDEKLDWMWPAKGKLVTGFSDTANLKGIDIAGTAGAPVVASAGGKVVYAGTGLRGYGKLVIVKHNGTYLTAYAHNQDIVVKEGQAVARGQKIAEMGNTDSEQVKLHFEIRRHGKPVDPIKYLPPA